MISLLGDDLLEEIESNLTVTFQLQWTGVSFGVIPLTILPVSYSDFERLRASFGVNSTLEDISAGRVIPVESAEACEHYTASPRVSSLDFSDNYTLCRPGLQRDSTDTGVGGESEQLDCHSQHFCVQ